MTTVEDDVNQSSVQINGTCLDLLLIELVPMASRMADRAVTERAYLIPSSDENDVLRADERRTAIQNHLDELGYRVGQAIVEQLSFEKPRFTNHLDIIKFLCKDFWIYVFRKQCSTLKTNHRGVFMLTDTSFSWFSKMSVSTNQDVKDLSHPHLWFPIGLIRGALSNFGVSAKVVAMPDGNFPSVTFEIRV